MNNLKKYVKLLSTVDKNKLFIYSMSMQFIYQFIDAQKLVIIVVVALNVSAMGCL